MRISNNSDRIAPARNPACEHRVVSEHGAYPHHYGAQLAADMVNVLPCRLARHPSGIARVRGDFTVQRHGVFHHYIRHSRFYEVKKYAVLFAAFFFENSGCDFESMRFENFCSAACLGVGVHSSDDDSLYP